MLSEEAFLHPAYKQKVLDADTGDTVLVGRGALPVRSVRNAFTERVEQAERDGMPQAAPDADASLLASASLKQASFYGDVSDGKVEAGQCAGLIHQLLLAAEIMNSLIEELEQALGHDEGARETVARFLMQLGFEPIILHEQANQGRTVMEKVEAHGQVDFAVVLLTPDDEGCAKGGKPEPRARQNVLLELGYFLGRLGRAKVCALKRGTLEIPSDFAGVVWEPMEGNSWKQALGRELEAAGHEIDWNKVMRG